MAEMDVKVEKKKENSEYGDEEEDENGWESNDENESKDSPSSSKKSSPKSSLNLALPVLKIQYVMTIFKNFSFIKKREGRILKFDLKWT